MADEPRHKEPARKAYGADGITVLWEPRLCIHTGHCFRNLGAVFQPWDRPWVKPDRTTPDRIAEVVRMCPTGALQYETPAGPEVPTEGLEVTAMPDGPLYMRGNFELKNHDGTVLPRRTRVALCRCGQSKNKPFCDGSHRTCAFIAAERATAPQPSPNA